MTPLTPAYVATPHRSRAYAAGLAAARIRFHAGARGTYYRAARQKQAAATSHSAAKKPW